MRLVGHFAAGGGSRRLQSLLYRFSAVAALAVAAIALSLYLATPSWADAPDVTVQLSPAVIAADGVSSTTATATVHDAGGNLATGETVTITSSDAGDTVGTVNDNGDGTYSATITSSTTPGQKTITASDAALSVSGQAMLIEHGPASTVAVMLSPGSIVANGTSTTTATAIVQDAGGNPVPGDNISFSSSDSGNQFGSVTDNGDGSYSATLTSSTTAGTPTITATDNTASVSGDNTLTQTAGPAANVALSFNPNPIVANGMSTSTATATVTDANNNPVIGQTVTLSSGATDFGSMVDQGDGTYTATVTSTTTAGGRSFTATDGAFSGQATLTQTAGPAANVALSFSPNPIVANGSSTSTARATVTDANGNRVTGQTVTLSSGATNFGSMADQGDGTYTATVTSTTAAGDRTFTATDGALSDQATLTQTAGPAATVALTLNPTSIVANGTSTSTATATVTDANGNPAPNQTVTLSSGGTMSPQGGGTYTGTVTSTTTAGNRTITATDGNVSGQATLTQTAGPAAHVALSLQPSSIVANGTSTSTATATVTDANGNPVSGDTVTLSSGGTMTDQGGGTYRGTVTSTTTAGSRTITATDGSISGQASLTQTPGPAKHATLSLHPTQIVANGIAETTATLTVTDINGNRVPGETIHFTSDDTGQLPGQVTDNGDGTYSAQIRSSTTVGQATIKGVDTAANIAGQAFLTQVNSPSTTTLTVSTASAVTNQPVTLVAAVHGTGTPHGAVTFESSGSPIAACSNQPLSPSSGTATCTTTFGASNNSLTAVFSPDAQSTVDGSTSAATGLAVGQDSTSVALGLSSPAVKINATETLVAFVTPAHTGSLSPSGTVTFLDNGARIAQCASQSLLAAGGGGSATCAVSWPSSASHKITAVYNGDTNFAGSQSSPSNVPVQFLGTLNASMHWSFVSGPGYTSVLALTVNGAPIGSTVLISCHGKGCPFANKSLAVTKTKRCGPKGKRVCQTHGNVDLTSRFAKSHLRPRATITVNVVQAGWIGRAYTFVVRSHKGPSTKAVCVAPGTSAPTSC